MIITFYNGLSSLRLMQNTELAEKTTDALTTQTLADKHCENCQQPLSGSFCSQCGQEDKSSLKYFWSVILHLLDDIFSFDSRASRTIWPLIARPGFLTNEYFVGKRVHYVPPLRLYLFISIIFFISLKFTSTDNDIDNNINDNKTVISKINKHIQSLENAQLVESKRTPPNAERLSILSKDLSKFNLYLKDLNLDYITKRNAKVIDIIRELAELEFAQIDQEKPRPEDEKLQYQLLLDKLTKAKEAQKNRTGSKRVLFGTDDGNTIFFDFLSDENNDKFHDFFKRLNKKAEKAFDSADTRPLTQQVISKLPQLMFLLLPIFALLLKVMFIFSKRLYMEHLTVALHSHSFIFFAILLMLLSNEFHNVNEVSSPIVASTMAFIVKALTLWLPIYLFIMQKRVYKQGYFITLIKYSIIATIYSILIAVTALIALIWGLADI